jgi:hypothetical protein
MAVLNAHLSFLIQYTLNSIGDFIFSKLNKLMKRQQFRIHFVKQVRFHLNTQILWFLLTDLINASFDNVKKENESAHEHKYLLDVSSFPYLIILRLQWSKSMCVVIK